MWGKKLSLSRKILVKIHNVGEKIKKLSVFFFHIVCKKWSLYI